MRNYAFVSEEDAFYTAGQVPERGLLSAVLERAYRDLYCSSFEDFRAAMFWFMCDDDCPPDDFTSKIYYKQVKEILGLSPSRVEFIKNLVEEFRHYLDDRKQFVLERPKVIKIRQKKVWSKGYRVMR